MTEQGESGASPTGVTATMNDVAQAVAALTVEDLARLYKAAAICFGGTPYGTPDELVKDALSQTCVSASGGPGRRWPKDVHFVAFMVNTIQGLASDSRKAAARKRTVSASTLKTGDEADPFGALGHTCTSVEDDLVAQEEQTEREAHEEAVLAKIREFFLGDTEVLAIVDGILNDLSPAEVQQKSNMTEVQYASARRRWRRGVAKLFAKELQQ